MASIFSHNGEIEMTSRSHIIDIKQETGFGIDQEGLVRLMKGNYIEKKNADILCGTRLAELLKTDIRVGICSEKEDIGRRVKAFGSNVNPSTKSYFHFVRHALKDLTIIILLSCAVLSLGFGMKVNGAKEGWIDGLSIFLAVFFVTGVSATCNYKHDRQFNQLLKNYNNIYNDVTRDGRRQLISRFEVVVGEIISLLIGDQVPADGLLLEGDLDIVESSMTVERDSAKVGHVQGDSIISRRVQIDRTKDIQDLRLFSGATVVDGYGLMLVTSVGMNTKWGQMMSQISHNSKEQMPLQAGLDKLSRWNSFINLITALPVIIVLFVRYFTGNTKDENGNKQFNGSRTNIHEVLNITFAIIRAAVTIQKGLHLAVKLFLAYAMKEMIVDKIEVRKLSTCETMGRATTICTDSDLAKQMEVTEFWLGTEPVGKYSCSKTILHLGKIFREGIALNTADKAHGTPPSLYWPNQSDFLIFSRTEEAIISWASQILNMDINKVKQTCRIKRVEPFNPQTKRSGVLIRRMADKTLWVHWKGDAENILAMCSSYYDASKNVEIKYIGKNEKMKFEKIIQGVAARGLKCIAFAHKQGGYLGEPLPTKGLILTGLLCFKRTCHPEVKNATKAFQSAGVNVKMITSDNVFDAKATATECGILGPHDDMSNGAVIEAEEFQKLSEEGRRAIVDKIRVMAGASSNDKRKMVKCLREKGHVVAVTGDGADDALALKEADIGLGNKGSECVEESSIVVEDFTSLLTVFKLGRCIYNNVQKVIQFQLTANLSALVINFVTALSEREVPLTAIPLLWTNLIMDTLGALALATEEPTAEPTPVLPREPIITNIMWSNILSQAFYQTVVLLVVQFRGKSILNVNDKVKDTLTFNTFILCQIFNVFSSRKLEKKNVFEGIHRNKLFLGIISLSLVLQVLMLEFLNKYTDTERLNWVQWSACVGLAALSWPIGWVVKFVVNYGSKEKIE